MSQVLASLPPRKLARLGRQIATTAMTIELAAERGDWETVHQGHDRLIGLYEEYRATYTNLLGQGLHRPRPLADGEVEVAPPLVLHSTSR
jgi:hypothetical protein